MRMVRAAHMIYAPERFITLREAISEEKGSMRHPDGTMCEEPVDEAHLVDDEKAEG